MRRLGLAIILLGIVGFAAFGLAARSKAQAVRAPEGQAPDSRGLRERVVQLRSEVEWLELERDVAAERKAISAIYQTIQQKSGPIDLEMSALKDPSVIAQLKKIPENRFDEFYEEELKDRKILKQNGETPSAALQRGLIAEAMKEAETEGVKVLPGEDALEAIRRHYVRKECGLSLDEVERIKAKYLRRANELNAKRLDLAEAEQRYQESKRLEERSR